MDVVSFESEISFSFPNMPGSSLEQNEDGEPDIFPGNVHQRDLEPTDVSWLSHAFPFASTSEETRDSLRGLLLQMVPAEEETRRIMDLYCYNAAWM